MTKTSKKILTRQPIRQPIEVIERNGVLFYILAYQPEEVWVAGIDIAKELGFKDPGRYARNLFYSNKKWLESQSRLILVPRKTAETTVSLRDGLLDQNFHETRVYNEIGFNFFVSISPTKKARDHLLAILEDYHDLKKRRRKNKPSIWRKLREEGKLERKNLTHVIQLFVDYAKTRGSKGADWYYKLFSQKINKILFQVNGKGTPKDFREHLNQSELKILSVVEERIADYILTMMDMDKPYKDIANGFTPILDNARAMLHFNAQQMLD